MVELAPFSAAWTSYTPSWSGITIGNATNTGAYLKVGKMVIFRAKITLGSTSSITGQISATFPFTAKTSNAGVFWGSFEDTGTGWYIPNIFGDTIGMSMYATIVNGTYAGAASTSSTVPFTWTTGDVIYASGNYEIS